MTRSILWIIWLLIMAGGNFGSTCGGSDSAGQGDGSSKQFCAAWGLPSPRQSLSGLSHQRKQSKSAASTNHERSSRKKLQHTMSFPFRQTANAPVNLKKTRPYLNRLALRCGGNDVNHDTTGDHDNDGGNDTPDLVDSSKNWEDETSELRPIVLGMENQAPSPPEDDDGTPPSFRDSTVKSNVRPILIVMDAFCPYHGLYLIEEALGAAGAIVIPVLSDYLRHYLLQTEPELRNRWQAMRIPKTEVEAQEWINNLFSSLSSTSMPPSSNDSKPEITAVYCESDSGLEEAEYLRQLLNVTCRDDPVVLPARRDKYLMNEQVRQYSDEVDGGRLRTARQKLCKSMTETCNFAQSLFFESSPTTKEGNMEKDDKTSESANNRRFVVVKPCRGVASELVFLCRTMEEVQKAWKDITSSAIFGKSPIEQKQKQQKQNHEYVLVQEFLRGTEYAVDVVSRNGHHKIAAIWKYDKRPANGAPFCYFQTKLVDATMEPIHVPLIQKYARQVLDTLGIRYGFTHTEIIMVEEKQPDSDNSREVDTGRESRETETVPVLVEVNCRQHNMEFMSITMPCIGYNALDMTLVALLEKHQADDGIATGMSINAIERYTLGEEKYEPSHGDNENESLWDLYPDNPLLRRHGCMVHLVNYCQGVLRQVHHMDEISQLPSFYCGQLYDLFQPPDNEDSEEKNTGEAQVGGNDDFKTRNKWIRPTTDIRSDAGWIQLINDDYTEMQRDYLLIVDWMPSMFEVEQ